MTDQDGDKQQKGGGILALLRRPSTRYSLGGILVVGIVAGIIFWGGFNTALEATNTETFCISCHEMGNNVYPASKELWGKIVGTIDTQEKFEAKRLTLARREWARMRASDSRECRNCHSLESMSSDKQKQRARKQHEMAREDNLTCIACHKGIAHHLPEGMTEEDED